MRFLPDTHLPLWAVGRAARLLRMARDLMADPVNMLFFSAARIGEIAIKRSLGRPGFATDPRLVHSELLAQNYEELSITSNHGVVADGLAFIHKDPSDRLLVAQAMIEGNVLLTPDARLARYPGPTRKA